MIIKNKTRLSCCLLANVTSWNPKVPILNAWAFVGGKEMLRQKIEIPSLVPPACAHMKLRAWVQNPDSDHVVSWPGERTDQPMVVTCSDLDMTRSLS
jgi:hypothetical protein